MNTLNRYLIVALVSLSASFGILNAEAKISDSKKKSSGSSYLEKIQRRYISRLPYLMIPVMVVPVIKKSDLAGHLTIMVELKSTGIDNYRELQVETIKLRDEIFCDLYSAMSQLWLGPEAPAASILENRIKKRVNTFYKREMVENVRLHIMQLSLIRNA
jgi:hypothetical protein